MRADVRRIIKTEWFTSWFDSLRDPRAKADVLRRINRAAEGNFGDHRGVAGGISELRIHQGPGYRVYYGEDGPVVVLLLCGGAKDAQSRDIALAARLWKDYLRNR